MHSSLEGRQLIGLAHHRLLAEKSVPRRLHLLNLVLVFLLFAEGDIEAFLIEDALAFE